MDALEKQKAGVLEAKDALLAQASGDRRLLALADAIRSKDPHRWAGFEKRFSECWAEERESWCSWHKQSAKQRVNKGELSAHHLQLFHDEFDCIDRSLAVLVGYAMVTTKTLKTKNNSGCSFVHRTLIEHLLQLVEQVGAKNQHQSE